MELVDTKAVGVRVAQVVARLPLDERMEVLLEWLGICLIGFAVIMFLVYRWSRGTRALKHVSRRALRKMYTAGKITLAEYEQERQRRRRGGKP